jgi:hypothetical protein
LFPLYIHHVPLRNVKCALALVVRLFLEHSKVTESSIMVQDSTMLLNKETTNADVFHSNSFGKVNANFAHFLVIDFLSILLLFDAYTDHNVNASPAPWAGRNFSMSEREMIQKNQLVLIMFCLKQHECMAWKSFGTNKHRQLGWQVGECDSLLSASVRCVSKFKSNIFCVLGLSRHIQGREEEGVNVDSQLLILPFFHPKFLKIDSPAFLHDNHSSFVCQFTTNKLQEYTYIFEEFPNYNWLWLG